MRIEDLGKMPYRDAWARQEAVHARVVAGGEGGEEAILLVEHPPVITFGRRPGAEVNLVAKPDYLAQLGVEVVQSDRGGNITFHGPGQIVAYPIVRLHDHGLSVGDYVQRLQDCVVATLNDIGIESRKDRDAVGVWVDDHGTPAKICALGVRIRRGVSLHGIALNVTTDLRFFNLIVPCGLTGRTVTSIARLLGPAAPSMETVKSALVRRLCEGLSAVE